MYTILYTVCRGDDEFPLEVDYDITPFFPAKTSGPPELCYPAEGGEVERVEAWHEGERFELTTEELSKLERYIQETHEF